MLFRVTMGRGQAYVRALNRDDAEEWTEMQFGKINGPYEAYEHPDEDVNRTSISGCKIWETHEYRVKKIKERSNATTTIDGRPTQSPHDPPRS
jgi:hypothetical protein